VGINIKTPSQVAQEYLDNLKVLRPEVNIDLQDSEWWVRSRVVGGTLAGVYADINRVSNDVFPQSARRDSVDKHLQTHFGSGLRQPTTAQGTVLVTGAASGIVIPVNTQFIHQQSGQVYGAIETTTLQAATGNIPIRSFGTGQTQNLLAGLSLSLSAPPSGLQSTATINEPGLTDGSDAETTQAGALRVLAKIRNPSRGGTAVDYQNWAVAADSRVIACSVNRHAYGLGSVELVISAGTNDIDVAIDNDDPVIVTPSDELKEVVRQYVEALNPICDIVYVNGPVEKPVNITAKIAFTSGNQNTVVSGTGGKTQGQLVTREIRRAIYKSPVGGREVNGIKALRLSDIEELIDSKLSSNPNTVGLSYQFVGDRQISASGGTPNISLAVNEVAIPNVITIEDF
jgi:uncharacterized phage protein gp47/JayE